jgi:hypothetical protein
MRSDIWLKSRLENIWKVLMPEVNRQNIVNIKFKGNWKTKFGHIKRLKDGSTEIAINNLFRNEQIPDFIIDTTIAHELIHYMHGFHSPLPKQFTHPHQGRIVDKELKNRGFDLLLKLEKDWVKNKWWAIYPFLKQEIS